MDADLTLRCNCFGEIVTFDFYDDPDTQHSFVEFWTRVNSRSPFLYRLKVAWKVLRGQDHHLDAIVLTPTQMAELGEFLDKALTPKK